jgi:hypothetical protein
MLGGGGHALGGGGVAGAEAGVKFTCFTGTTVQIRTRRGGGARVCVSHVSAELRRVSQIFCLRYWYYSTDTDADAAHPQRRRRACMCHMSRASACTPHTTATRYSVYSHFTCFTSTKVQILTPAALQTKISLNTEAGGWDSQGKVRMRRESEEVTTLDV